MKYLTANVTNKAETSPAFQKTIGAKVRRYGALIDVVKRLVEDRKLNFQPTFLFPVLSSLGYMNEDMTQLIKSMVACFKETQFKQPKRLDGVENAVLKGRFKVELKNTLCIALVRCNALSINYQGQSGVVHPD